VDAVNNQDIRFVIHPTIDGHDKGLWNDVVDGRGVFLSIPYLQALERAGIPGLSFRYALLEFNDEPIAVYCFQLVDLSFDGIGGVLNLENYGGISSSIAGTINNLLFKNSENSRPMLLVCGSLLSSGEYGIVAKDDVSTLKAFSHYLQVRDIIVNELQGCRIVAEMVKDFYEHNNALFFWNASKIGFPLRTDPEMILELNPDWKDFDDYLASLSSKYRIRANAVRKSAINLTEQRLSLQEMESAKSQLEGLYVAVRDKAPIQVLKPGIEYLISLKDVLGDHLIVTAFYNGDNMVAFRTAIIWDNQLDAHYIGIDYELNRELDLYQNILYGLISDAIQNKVKRVMYGRTALEIKSTVGAAPYKLACYMRFHNKLLNTVIKTVVSGLGPKDWTPRSPFK
jgi:predicted N-acyltransferase